MPERIMPDPLASLRKAGRIGPKPPVTGYRLLDKIAEFTTGGMFGDEPGPVDLLVGAAGLRGLYAGAKRLVAPARSALAIRDPFGVKKPTKAGIGRREFLYKVGQGPKRLSRQVGRQTLRDVLGAQAVSTVEEANDLIKRLNFAKRILSRHGLAPGGLVRRLHPNPSGSRVVGRGLLKELKNAPAYWHLNEAAEQARKVQAAADLVSKYGSPEGVEAAIQAARREIAPTSPKPVLPTARKIRQLSPLDEYGEPIEGISEIEARRRADELTSMLPRTSTSLDLDTIRRKSDALGGVFGSKIAKEIEADRSGGDPIDALSDIFNELPSAGLKDALDRVMADRVARKISAKASKRAADAPSRLIAAIRRRFGQ